MAPTLKLLWGFWTNDPNIQLDYAVRIRQNNSLFEFLKYLRKICVDMSAKFYSIIYFLYRFIWRYNLNKYRKTTHSWST